MTSDSLRTAVATAVAAILLGTVPGGGQEAPTPAPVTPEAFAGLGWLDGRWVGSGDGSDGFYEAYRFLNDSTLEQASYPDASFREADRRATLELRDGRIRKVRDGAVESVVTRLVGDTLRFEWTDPGRPGFTWYRLDADRWRAVLDRPGGAEPVVYTLRRVP